MNYISEIIHTCDVGLIKRSSLMQIYVLMIDHTSRHWFILVVFVKERGVELWDPLPDNDHFRGKKKLCTEFVSTNDYDILEVFIVNFSWVNRSLM